MSTPPQEHDRSSRDRAGANRGGGGTRARRIAGLAVGTVLVARGLGRRSVRGVATALLGAGVLVGALRAGGESGDGVAGRGRPAGRTGGVAVRRSVTVGAPAEELYEAWRDPAVFSQVVGGFAEVRRVDEDRYRWTVSGPGGTELTWETRVVEADPGELLRWETRGDATVPNSGSVRFRRAPGDRGTVVTLSLQFDPPGGSVGTAVFDRLDVVPETLAGRMLGRFKSLVESGEIPSLAANPSGRGRGDVL